jgi:hypothetical protein
MKTLVLIFLLFLAGASGAIDGIRVHQYDTFAAELFWTGQGNCTYVLSYSTNMLLWTEQARAYTSYGRTLELGLMMNDSSGYFKLEEMPGYHMPWILRRNLLLLR